MPKKNEDKISEVAGTIKPREVQEEKPTELLPSGSTVLNCALSDNAEGGFGVGKIANIVGDSSAGKAQPLYSYVLTPSGFMYMSDINVGDMVISASSGYPCKVLGVFPQGEQDVYRIFFSDGTCADCTLEHLWKVQYDGNDSEVVPLQEIIKRVKHHDDCRKFSIPIAAPVNKSSENAYIPIPVYSLGVLQCAQRINDYVWHVRCDNEKCIERVRNELGYLAYDCTLLVDNVYQIAPKEEVRANVLDVESMSRYTLSTIDVRKNLLLGILDSRASVSEDGKYLLYTQGSFEEETVIPYLVRSLGGMVTTIQGKIFLINLPEIIAQQLTIPGCEGISDFRKEILGIAYNGKAECQCIKIDSPDGLYITDGFIVTHNTMMAETIFAEMANDPKYDKYKLILDDSEHALEMCVEGLFGKKAAERIKAPRYDENGLPINSDTIEQFFSNIMRLIQNGERFVYVLDSLDTLTDAAEYEAASALVKAADAEKDDSGQLAMSGSYGMTKQKMLSQILRTIKAGLAKTDSTLIVISQVRDNVNARPGQPTKRRSGGRALDFYCTHIIWLTPMKTLKGGKKTDEEVIGRTVKAEVRKNKLTGKIREAVFDIYYDYGVDDIGSCVDFLCAQGVLKKSGAYIEAPVLGVSDKIYRKDLLNYIEDNDKFSLLRELVGKAWKEKETSLKLPRKPRFA